MAAPLLQVEDLQVVFPTPRGMVRAVCGVSFDVEKGKIFGIVGESGCGKSVTGRAILKLVPPPGRIAGGQIRFHGEDLLSKSDGEIGKVRGRRIAMVFQDPAAALNPLFTIGQQLAMIMKRHQVAAASDIRTKAVQLLGDLGLPEPEEIFESYPHRLSGGMQQRAMIAMALCTEPDLIIADEPTSALDVTIQSQILDLLVSLRESRGVTIILITHDLGVVAETCDEVAVFYLGCIVEQGTVHDLFYDTRHPYTKGLLAAIPNPERLDLELKVIPGTIPPNLEPLPGCPFEPRCSERLPLCCSIHPPCISFNKTHSAACHLYASAEKRK